MLVRMRTAALCILRLRAHEIKMVAGEAAV